MIIIYSNSNNEPMVEIGADSKSVAVSLHEITILGLKEVVKKHFSKEEIKKNLNSWSEELYHELVYRENHMLKQDSIVANHYRYFYILKEFPDSHKHKISLKNVTDFQNKILLEQSVDLNELFKDIPFNDIKLVHHGREIKHVKQKHKTSCGLACVAMIAGVPYDEIFNKAKKMFKFRYKFLTQHKHRKKLLNQYGFDLKKEEACCSWKDVPDFSIAILEEMYSGNRHAIVFLRKDELMWFLDPEDEKIRYDFWNFPLSLVQYEEIVTL